MPNYITFDDQLWQKLTVQPNDRIWRVHCHKHRPAESRHLTRRCWICCQCLASLMRATTTENKSAIKETSEELYNLENPFLLQLLPCIDMTKELFHRFSCRNAPGSVMAWAHLGRVFPGSNPTEMNLLLLKLPKNVLKDDQIQWKPQNPHLLRFSMATSLVLGTLKTPNIPGLRYMEKFKLHLEPVYFP